jgi:hypothetical protein
MIHFGTHAVEARKATLLRTDRQLSQQNETAAEAIVFLRLAASGERPPSPCACWPAVQVLPKFEFACEPIDALNDWMPSIGKDGYERVPPAGGIILRQSTEGASRISPQHL